MQCRDVATLRAITRCHGKVFYKGEPAAGAVVYFHQEGSGAPSPQAIPFGIVEDDGSFSLTCDRVGNGCPPGKYAVLVEWRDGTGDGVVPVKTKGKTKLVKRSRVRSGPDRLERPLLRHQQALAPRRGLAPVQYAGSVRAWWLIHRPRSDDRPLGFDDVSD